MGWLSESVFQAQALALLKVSGIKDAASKRDYVRVLKHEKDETAFLGLRSVSHELHTMEEVEQYIIMHLEFRLIWTSEGKKGFVPKVALRKMMGLSSEDLRRISQGKRIYHPDFVGEILARYDDGSQPWKCELPFATDAHLERSGNYITFKGPAPATIGLCEVREMNKSGIAP